MTMAFRRIIPGLVLCLSLLACTTSSAQDQQEHRLHDFVDSAGELIYFLAWPTATYEGVKFDGVQRAPGGFDVQATVYGRSGIDDSSLWTQVILEIRDGQVSNLRWGRNDAVLFQPGQSMSMLGSALQELTRDYARQSSSN
jgi:hypothetical protein